jgi:CheY-like chemotaxis protein
MFYFNCILLIDDDPVSNAITEELLKQLYFTDEVKHVLSAQEGLDFIDKFYDEKKSFPELILIDIKMPGMDGFKFVEILNSRAISQDDAFKISALTSSSDERDIQLMTKLGVDHYIVKPLNTKKVKELLSAIN